MKLFIISIVLVLSIYFPADGRRVICYFTNWAGYRDGDGKYTPQDLDASKCTNVLYAFALLDSDSVTIKPSDSWADISENYYQDIVDISKKADAKPSLSLGGWVDSQGNKYSVLMNDEDKRKEFVNNAVDFLQRYGFEGLDLDIEYPTCPQGDCQGGNPNDKEGYAALIKELHDAFQPKGWVLSAAIGASPDTIDRAYDLNAMNENLDWIGVMTYDYHLSTGQETGPVSPLMTTSGDKYPDSNTKNTIDHLISNGADKSKLLVGVPFYGYSYKLADPANNGYWAPSNGQGPAGQFTKNAGEMSYYEICDLNKNQGYNNVENDALGAYTFKDDVWVSYNSFQDVQNKVNYVKENDLGGVIVWDTSFDDFKGKFCGQGNYPLLTEIKNNIG